jgi:hypothetical protein
MKSLAPVSSFALAALCYGVVCIAFYSGKQLAHAPPSNLPLANWNTFPSALAHATPHPPTHPPPPLPCLPFPSHLLSPVFFGNSLYMFEGVGLVVPLEMSLKDPSKFRFLFSSIVFLFSVFCMIIGVLVSAFEAPSPSSSSHRMPFACLTSHGFSLPIDFPLRDLPPSAMAFTAQ